MYLHQGLVEILELCDLVVHLFTKPSGKVTEDEGLGISLLVVVVDVSNTEVLLSNDDSILVVVAEILQDRSLTNLSW